MGVRNSNALRVLRGLCPPLSDLLGCKIRPLARVPNSPQMTDVKPEFSSNGEPDYKGSKEAIN